MSISDFRFSILRTLSDSDDNRNCIEALNHIRNIRSYKFFFYVLICLIWFCSYLILLTFRINLFQDKSPNFQLSVTEPAEVQLSTHLSSLHQILNLPFQIRSFRYNFARYLAKSLNDLHFTSSNPHFLTSSFLILKPNVIKYLLL